MLPIISTRAEIDERKRVLREILAERKPLQCCGCDTFDNVKMESSRTAYHFTGDVNSPDNPNKPIPLCAECAEEHHEYWDGLWAEYHQRSY